MAFFPHHHGQLSLLNTCPTSPVLLLWSLYDYVTAKNTSIHVTLESYLPLKWLILSIFGGNILTSLIVSILIKDITHEYTCVRFWLLVLTLVYSLPQSFGQFY